LKTTLITGAAGFIGRNLREALVRRPDCRVLSLNSSDAAEQRRQALEQADIIFHLAGVNRPPSAEQFAATNVGFTRTLCDELRAMGRAPKMVFTSSIQATYDNPYGNSKRNAEQELQSYAAQTGAELAIYRLKNVFGKWCRPNYNSVVATFCHNIARDLPIQISDPARVLDLAYIDDVIDELLLEIDGRPDLSMMRPGPQSHQITLGELAAAIHSFQASRNSLVMPDLSKPLARNLYATFLSYLPESEFAYPLQMKCDNRGELAEFIKSLQFGQIFVSRTKPGIHRGNHFHHTKTEKFLVLEGDAVIRFRHVERDDVIEYPVSGREFRVVDIPPGYTHSIENVGTSEMIVLFWASEIFDPDKTDTYYQEVA